LGKRAVAGDSPLGETYQGSLCIIPSMPEHVKFR
jgi:hypothetical protein